VGILKSVKIGGSGIILEFKDMGNFLIDYNDSFTTEVKKLTGQKIAILRTDIPEGEYIVREVSDRLESRGKA